MPDDLFDGIADDEDNDSTEEKPEGRVSSSLSQADPVAAALAACASGHDPGVVTKTREYLAEQTRLLKLQMESLHEEQAFRREEYIRRRASLRGQDAEGKLRRTVMRFRVVFQLLVSTLGVVIGGGVIIILHDAVTSQRVVIEPIRIAPGLTARVDGVILATSLINKLDTLQDATRSIFVPLKASGGWAGDIKLEIPEAKISISEMSRLLRERFGRDDRIEGYLTETTGGSLELTVRGSRVLPKAFPGASADLDHLTLQAAEYVFAQSQPLRWTAYLLTNARNDEAIQFINTDIGNHDSYTQARLLNDRGIALQNKGLPAEALGMYRATVLLKPDSWYAWNNIAAVLWLVGKEEEAWHVSEDMRRAVREEHGVAPKTAYSTGDALTWNLVAALRALAATPNEPYSGPAVGPQIAVLYALEHDPNNAELALKTVKQDPDDPTILAGMHLARGLLAADAREALDAARELDLFGAAYTNPLVSGQYTGYHCWIALAQEAVGRPDKADAALESGGSFVDCYRFRGDILKHRGDWRGAQNAYAQAVALAHDLPAAYYSWGVALADRGDFAAAAEKLREANRRGPHWADPLKAWGDVLTRQGQTGQALSKYDEALKYAPNWKELQQARESAKKHKS